jgi:hypothetical protein
VVVSLVWLGQALKVKGHGSYMAAVVVEGVGTSAQNRNVAFKALE